MLRLFAKYFLYSLIVLFILLLIALVFRVPLINYVIKENAPEGVAAKITELKFRPFSRGVILEGLTAKLAEPKLDLDLSRVELKGLGVSSDLNISWKSLLLNGIQLNLAQQQLALKKLALGAGQWQQEQGLDLKQLTLADIALSAEEPQAHAHIKQLVLHDITLSETQTLGVQELVVSGVTLNAKLKEQAKEPDVSANIEGLMLNGLVLDEKQALSFKTLQLHTIHSVLAATQEQPRTEINLGKVRLQKFASDLQQKLDVNHAELSEAQLAIKDWQWDISLASFALDAVQLKDFNEAKKLKLGLAKIDLKQLLWQTDSQQKQPVQALSVEQVQVDDVAMQDNVLAIKQLGIGAVLMHVIRSQNETVNLAPPIMAESSKSKQEAAEADSKADEKDTALALRLHHLTLLKPANIHWYDKVFKPSFKETLLIKQLDLKQLSTVATDPDTQLNVLATLGKHGNIDLKGHFHPLTLEDNFTFDLKVKKLELPGISPYAEQGIGYALESGQFNLDLLIKARQSQLDGKAQLDLFNVSMRVEDEAVSGRINQELTMPLPTAIYLLEDSKKHITLTMPLKGSMDDPNFSWSGIMRFITLKAIRTASVYYLKQAILPQTTLVSLVDLFGGMVYNKITELPPMPYQAGVVELNKSHKKLLDQVAKTMQKKDKLSFRLCATANSADGDKEQALKLANQRVDFIRQYLVAERKIESGRLLSCLSKYEAKAKNSVVMIKL